MPKIVKMPKPKAVREAEKQRVKTLYCAGQSITDAARAVGVNQQTAFKWQQREKWKQQVMEAQALVQASSNSVQLDARIAFDFASTKKETRSSWARSSLKVAKWAEETAQTTPEILFEMGSQYKAHVESAAKIAGDWEDVNASRFAVALNINALPQGQVVDLD